MIFDCFNVADNPPCVLNDETHVRVFMDNAFVSSDNSVKLFLACTHLNLISQLFCQLKVL